MDPSCTTAEQMWAKRGILDPATRLLDWTAWTRFFFLFQKYVASVRYELWLVAGVCAARAGSNLEIHCFNFGSPRRRLSPKKGCHSTGAVARCGGAEDWLKCYLTS